MAMILICLTTSDWIAVLNILITSFIGVWIGVSVQKNLTTNRAVKEYFINENKDIKEKYNKFMNDLYSNRLSSEKIKEWFKIMTIKISTFEGFITNEYKLKPDIINIHNSLKYMITATEDFNTQYKKEYITFSNSTKNDILLFHTDISNSLTKLVIETNRANRKYLCRNKYGQHTTKAINNGG
jgi:hypothetical protein